MKITGLTRIRNEEAIIADTIEHMSQFCDEIFVFDDASTDKTLSICQKYPIIAGILENRMWSVNRAMAETVSRSQLLHYAKNMAPDTDWFVYMDADERIDFPWDELINTPPSVNGIRMRLFDYYITPDDVDKHYSERKMIGPEYRSILMAFRNIPSLIYDKPDQRSPRVPGKIIEKGFVKHYGKAVSVEQWENTCNYYACWFPKYSGKWERRKGKAVHTKSDFGRELITWEEKETKGIKLY